jgi:tetratricopeptide (TPR) repeat protein
MQRLWCIVLFAILTCCILSAANTSDSEEIIENKLKIEHLERKVNETQSVIEAQQEDITTRIQTQFNEMQSSENALLYKREKWANNLLVYLSVFFILIAVGILIFMQIVNRRLTKTLDEKSKEAFKIARNELNILTEYSNSIKEKMDKQFANMLEVVSKARIRFEEFKGIDLESIYKLEKDEINNTIGFLKNATTALNGITEMARSNFDEYDKEIAEIVENARVYYDDMKKHDVKQLINSEKKELNIAIRSAKDTSAKLSAFSARTMQKFDSMLDTSTTTIASITDNSKTILNEIQTKFNSIIDLDYEDLINQVQQQIDISKEEVLLNSNEIKALADSAKDNMGIFLEDMNDILQNALKNQDDLAAIDMKQVYEDSRKEMDANLEMIRMETQQLSEYSKSTKALYEEELANFHEKVELIDNKYNELSELTSEDIFAEEKNAFLHKIDLMKEEVEELQAFAASTKNRFNGFLEDLSTTVNKSKQLYHELAEIDMEHIFRSEKEALHSKLADIENEISKFQESSEKSKNYTEELVGNLENTLKKAEKTLSNLESIDVEKITAETKVDIDDFMESSKEEIKGFISDSSLKIDEADKLLSSANDILLSTQKLHEVLQDYDIEELVDNKTEVYEEKVQTLLQEIENSKLETDAIKEKSVESKLIIDGYLHQITEIVNTIEDKQKKISKINTDIADIDIKWDKFRDTHKQVKKVQSDTLESEEETEVLELPVEDDAIILQDSKEIQEPEVTEIEDEIPDLEFDEVIPEQELTEEAIVSEEQEETIELTDDEEPDDLIEVGENQEELVNEEIADPGIEKSEESIENVEIIDEDISELEEETVEHEEVIEELISETEDIFEIDPDEEIEEEIIEEEIILTEDALLNNAGIEKFNEGNLEDAISEFTSAIEFNPENSEAYFNRGIALAESGNIEDALQDYQTVLVLNPGSDKVHYNIGLINYSTGDFEEAFKHFSTTIELNANNAEAYFNRGLINYRNKKLDAALEDYSQAIELNPNDEGAFYSRGNVRFIKKDHQGAIDDFTKVIELNPQKYQAYYNRGILRLKLDDTEGAFADHSKVIELNPENDKAYYNRGVVEESRENLTEAITDFTRAIELNPQNHHAFYNRGNVFVDTGDHTAALEDYERTLELHPYHVNASINFLEILIITSRKFQWYEYNDKFKKFKLNHYDRGLHFYISAIADCVFNNFNINNVEVSDSIINEIGMHKAIIDWSFDLIANWARKAKTLDKKQKNEIKGLTAKISKFVKKHNKEIV